MTTARTDKLPTHMEEDDYNLFKFLVNKRLQAILNAMTGVDVDMLVAFLRSAGGNKDALDEVKATMVGISGLQKTYSLGKLDEVREDRFIVRKDVIETLDPDEIAAMAATEHLNGHTPTPLRSRAQRRHKDA